MNTRLPQVPSPGRKNAELILLLLILLILLGPLRCLSLRTRERGFACQCPGKSGARTRAQQARFRNDVYYRQGLLGVKLIPV